MAEIILNASDYYPRNYYTTDTHGNQIFIAGFPTGCLTMIQPPQFEIWDQPVNKYLQWQTKTFIVPEWNRNYVLFTDVSVANQALNTAVK